MRPPNAQSDSKAAEVPGLAYRFRQASRLIAFLVATLGLVVFCGWAFNVPTLTYLRPTFQSMKVNTALSFLCLGVGLWLARNDNWKRTRRLLGLLVVIIAGSTLAEYAFHVDLGIDQLLFGDTRTASLSAYPGRMAVATAICFLLLGLAVAFLGIKKAIVLQRSIVGTCFTFSLVALCGYLYGVKSLYSSTSFSTMAVHTVAGLMAGCLAYFLARPDEGIVSIAASDSHSGLLLRTLIPAIVIVPILIGWLRLAGQRASLYDTPFGIALHVLGNIGCLSVVTVLIVRSMHRFERERGRIEEALKKSEEKFSKAFRGSPLVVAITRMRDHRYLDVSESFEQWIGWRREEVIGRTPLDIGIWVDLAERSEFVKRLRADGVVRNLEFRYRRKDGVEMVGLGSGELIEIGNEQCVISVIADITERKLAEERVRVSEERLRLAQWAARIGTFDLNLRTGVDIWTPETEALYGLPPGGFAGTLTAFENLLHPDDRQRVIDFTHEMMRTGQPIEGEWRVVWPDGSVHWIAGRGQVFMNESGEPSRMLGVNIDVTDRKLAEQELATASERLHLAINSGSVGGWDFDIKTDRNVWFGKAHAQLGMAHEETLGSRQEFWDRVHEDDREHLRHAIRVAKDKHEEFTEDFRVVWRDGTTHWLRSRGRYHYAANGEPERMLGISLDITQSKQAEEALRESEQRLRLATQAGRMYAYDWDLTTNVVVRSSEHVKILGLTGPMRFPQQQFMDKIHPDDRPKFLAAIAGLTPENQTGEVTYRALASDGALVWLKSNGRGFFDAEGRLLRVIGMVADVTDQKRAEETLSGMTRKLVEAQEQERTRIARELHDDINQRLALLAIGLNQLREKHDDLPSEARDHVLELQQMTADLCSGVYALSHELHFSTLDLLGLSKGMSSWCKTFGERHKIEIDFKNGYVPQLPQEISLCLFRVLQEAVHNAAKHSGVKRVDVQLVENSGEIHLIVRDSGKGFDIEAASQSRRLGLTSMQERVRLVDGTIAIESKPMGGTAIRVRVPIESKQLSQGATVS